MKIGLLGLFTTDLTDVDREKVKWAGELGFHGIGAHIIVPPSTISDDTARRARDTFAEQGMPFLQLWGPYPCIISPDESVRRAGVAGAADLARLAAKMGVTESGVRPTSLNPRGDWWPHADNYKPETEDRLVKSLKEILHIAEDHGVDIILETHVTTTLNTAQTIKRVIERTESKHLRLNLDPCNFVGDLHTAFNLKPMLDEIFDVLGQYIATVHLKDFYLEDRLVVHIAETVIGTGLMDFDTILEHVNRVKPDGYVVIEHLPVGLIPLAKQNLTQKIKALGLPLG
jgi:sugar phosphate isomerase/epimerase